MRENLALSFFWLTSNIQWTALIIIVVPQVVLRMVGAAHSGAAVSWLTAAGALLASVIQPLIGAISDRSRHRAGRRRPFMVAGVIGTAVMLLLMGFFKNYAPFLAAYLGLQIFSNLASAPYQALIPDVVRFEQRGVASGYMGLMTQAAIIGGVLIPTFFSVRLTFEILALLQLVGLLVTIVGVPEVPLTERIRWNLRQFVRAFWISPRVHRDWWWVFFTRLLVMLGFSTLEYYLYYYLHFVQGLANPNAELDKALIAVTLASLLSVLTAGWLSDRLKRRKIMVLVGGLVMGVAALGFVFTKSLTMVIVFALIFGLGYGTYLSTDWALAVDVLPAKDKDAAKDMGLWSISQTLAQTIATAVAGVFLTVVVSRFGNALAYRALFVITFAYFLVGSLLVLRVRRVR